MSNGVIYPAAPTTQSIVAIATASAISAIITQRAAGKTKAEAIGLVLNSVTPKSNDVATFNTCWAQVDAEKRACDGVNPVDYETEVAYKTALDTAGPNLSSTTWFTGMKSRYGVASFTALKTALEG